MNSSPSSDIWEKMRLELEPLFNGTVGIVQPTSLSPENQKWFQEIEAQSFRDSLRYDLEELRKRLSEKNVLFLFVIVNEKPECVILGYEDSSTRQKIFYLDTVATRTRGKGIGRIMFQHIIQWARIRGYKTITLDTEEVTEIGIPLVRFYKQLGFIIQNIEDDGNVTMTLQL